MRRKKCWLIVWERNEYKVKKIINDLKNRYKFYIMTTDEILPDVQSKFHELWAEYWDDDEQYLRFFFVVTKNLIHTLQRREYRYANKHHSNLQGKNGEETNYIRILSEIAIDKNTENNIDEQIKHNEIVEQVLELLINETHKDIFRLMIKGYISREICDELGKSMSHVREVKVNEIYPIVKYVMEIPDEKYKYYASSGRIYV